MALSTWTATTTCTQSAAAAAIAVAGEVTITTNGKIFAGDDGVVGISVADADAEVSQTLVQTPSGLLPVGNPGVVDLAQLSHQYGLGHGEWSGYDPDAFAFAEADEVNISITGKVYAGDTGVVAISKAEAYAEGDYPIAVAISDDVNVEISGKVKAQGTGVFAGSFADASVGEAGCPEDSCYRRARQCHGGGEEGQGAGWHWQLRRRGQGRRRQPDRRLARRAR